MGSRKILYVDMDNVLVDFESGIARLPAEIVQSFEGRLDEVPDIFSMMRPIDGAIEAYAVLARGFGAAIRHLHPVDGAVGERIRVARQARMCEDSSRRRCVQTVDPHASQESECRRLSDRRQNQERRR